VADVGETGLLERLRPWLAPDGGDLLAGAGDDAAAWQPPPGHAVVMTTDSLVEGVHFTTPLTAATAADLGWRLMAVSLSDLAAMGATPGPALISLALPGAWPVSWVEALYQGLGECGARWGATLAGGNISASPAAVLASTCLGSAAAAGVLRRHGAEAGWQLAVTGPLGAAAAALRARREGAPVDAAWSASARPIPRLDGGRALVASGVTVALDVSDGLYLDAARLLEGAACSGLLIDAGRIPVAAGVRGRWPEEWVTVAGGGEDYELLFAGPDEVIARGCSALASGGLEPSVIGSFDQGPGLRLLRDGQETKAPAAGHEHYRA
jgi:thiamine-monophosphate kinase